MSFANIISLVTLIVVAGTLVVYGIQANQLIKQTRLLTSQMKTTDDTHRAQVSLSTNSMMHRLSRMLLEHPELRDYIYGTADIPADEPMRTRVLLTAEMFIDFMATTLDHAPFFPPMTYQGWRRYFRELIAGSPTLKYWWAETRHWYEPPVQELLDPVVFPGGAPVPAPAAAPPTS